MNSKTASPTAASPPAIRHVLIVDSQDMIRTILCSLLRSWGFRTRAADNLAGACRMVIGHGPFDVIICNYDLADGDAYDLIDWMREQQLEVPAIVPFGALQPASPPPENVKLISKPFDPLELREAIESAAQLHIGKTSHPVIRRKSALPRSRQV